MISIKEARKAKGLTQRALADAAGLNLSQIAKLETGVIKIDNVTYKNGLALADALGVDPRDLLEVDDERR